MHDARFRRQQRWRWGIIALMSVCFVAGVVFDPRWFRGTAVGAIIIFAFLDLPHLYDYTLLWGPDWIRDPLVKWHRWWHYRNGTRW